MKRDNVRLVLVEPYFDLRTPTPSRAPPAGQVLVLLPSVGGEKQVTDYFKLFDYDINLLTTAFAKVQIKDHMDILSFLLAPFVASLILTGIHAYLGVHVVERGVVFVDLSLAQIAALGTTIAVLYGFDPHGAVLTGPAWRSPSSAQRYFPPSNRTKHASRRKRSSASVTPSPPRRPSSP